MLQSSFFTSERYTYVAIETVVTIGSTPIFAGIFGRLLFKRRPTRVWAIATILAIFDVVLLFVDSGEAVVEPFGIMLALCAGILFALYTISSKKLMEREDTLPAVAVTFIICAIMLLPLTARDGFGWLTVSGNVWPMLFMALAATSLALIIALAGLQKINASSAFTLGLAEPLTAALLSVFLLGEYLSPTSWGGVMLMLCGIVLLTFGTRQKQILW